MKLKEIIEFIDKNIPKNLALENDEIGFKKEYNLNQDISSIKIFMDLYPEFDTQKTNTLILTHHPPLFNPKTPTYTIHSNWDIINGGANEALAETLKLMSYHHLIRLQILEESAKQTSHLVILKKIF